MTIGGTGIAGHTGDGGPARSAQIDHPQSVIVDTNGNIYVFQRNSILRKIDTNSVITTVTNTRGWGVAEKTNFASRWITVDSVGNYYYLDSNLKKTPHTWFS